MRGASNVATKEEVVRHRHFHHQIGGRRIRQHGHQRHVDDAVVIGRGDRDRCRGNQGQIGDRDGIHRIRARDRVDIDRHCLCRGNRFHANVDTVDLHRTADTRILVQVVAAEDAIRAGRAGNAIQGFKRRTVDILGNQRIGLLQIGSETSLSGTSHHLPHAVIGRVGELVTTESCVETCRSRPVYDVGDTNSLIDRPVKRHVTQVTDGQVLRIGLVGRHREVQ